MTRRLIACLVLIAASVGLAAIAGGLWGCASSGHYQGAPATGAPPPPQGQREAAAVAPADELWVIEKPEPEAGFTNEMRVRSSRGLDGVPPTAPEGAAEVPGTGALVAKLPGQQKTIPVPLKHTDVRAAVAGYIATVDVTQQYHNPFSEKIEAVYVFPLPANAAVNEFVMTIGDRRIRGIIRERDEARRIYDAARAQGHVASLLTQERPNVFTQSVANIEPGKQIDVNLKYFHTLEYVDGWYEFVFPMVVGPRFNPPHVADGIGAAARGDRGASGQKTEVQYLKPDERSGHDISLALDIDAGVKVEQVESRNHRVAVSRPQESTARVQLASDDAVPNKDFVLRYKVAGDRVKSAVMVQRDERGVPGGSGDGGYFTLMLFPPETLKDLPRQPLEMVFTLDVSGSMSGRPMQQSKAAMRYALRNMDERDTFNVVRFAGNADEMARRAVPVTDENVRRAMRFVEATEAGGGTMMIEGIRKSLQVTPSEDRLRFVAFLTDGYIGNEAEILREIHHLRGPSRIFSFGVGQSVNRYLLDHMAKMGAGCAAYLSLNDDAERVMASYFDRISHPALTDIEIDWGGLQVSEVYPRKVPDLFVGRPVILTGRLAKGQAAGDAVVRVRGRVGGAVREMTIPLALNGADAARHRGIKPVWARMKISDLGDQLTFDTNPELPLQIRQVALDHGLMSAYTSFVAVDASTVTAGDHGTTVAVPVPVPEGVRYETTVPEPHGPAGEVRAAEAVGAQ